MSKGKQVAKVEEDVKMENHVNYFESMIKLGDGARGNTYLIKMPQWIADSIAEGAPGTEIGFSHDILSHIGGDASHSKEELRLVVSKPSKNQPAEYGLSVPPVAQNSRVFRCGDSSTAVSRVHANVHMMPKRDEKYATLLKERLEQAEQSNQHRTVHNEEDYSVSRSSVKLFQRPDAATTEVTESAGSPEYVERGTKRIRALDELPQRETRGSPRSTEVLSLDDALMETLVNRDEGWPLQQLSKALKEKGVTAPMAQLKAKLLDICVYQRRGEDTHPKYYLKSEYK